MAQVRVRPCLGEAEYPALVAIWASAVDATHTFLSTAHRREIEERVPTYFPLVQVTVAEVEGRPVGFIGTADGSLEMLFIHSDARGRGIGGLLVDHVVRTEQVDRVDVNEQNAQAVGFYQAKGFETVGRSEQDEEGYPYPILHLRLPGSGPGLGGQPGPTTTG